MKVARALFHRSASRLGFERHAFLNAKRRAHCSGCWSDQEVQIWPGVPEHGEEVIGGEKAVSPMAAAGFAREIADGWLRLPGFRWTQPRHHLILVKIVDPF